MAFKPPVSKLPALPTPPTHSPSPAKDRAGSPKYQQNHYEVAQLEALPGVLAPAERQRLDVLRAKRMEALDRRIQRAELLGHRWTYNSAQPAGLGTLADAPGRNIEMRSAQDGNLPAAGRHLVQRVPADFQPPGLLVYNHASSWTRLFSSDVPWYDFRVHLDQYKVLAPAAHQQRKIALSDLENDVQDWQVAYAGKTVAEKETAETMGKRLALQVMGSMIRDEWMELEEFGSTLNEDAQLIRSKRLKLDYVLEAVMEGRKVVRAGEEGLYVRKIQRSLVDLGHLAVAAVSGQFDGATQVAVRAFQAAAGIAQTGIVDAATMIRLDRGFTDYASENTLATAAGAVPNAVEGTEYDVAATPAALLAGTHALSNREKPMVRDAIRSGGAVAVGGALPVFQPDIAAGNYKARVKAKANEIVDDQYQQLGHGKAALRADPANLFQAVDIDRVATAAKAQADSVFGKYARSPALQYGVSILDKWDFETGRIAASAAYGDNKAAWRVRKIIEGGAAVKAIDRQHGAVQSRGPESVLLAQVVAEIVAVKRDQLLETHKGWPASAGGGQIKLQRFKGANDRQNRSILWELFQTVIHEYTHTLEHSASIAYRQTLDQQAGGFTIREGFTDYFTRIAWHNTTINVALRQAIEGPMYDVGDPIAPPRLGTYKEADQAERVASIIGFENLAAAYFLGHVDRLQHT